jgi:glycosyltransferase involved in cell wall biosynthesis
VGAELTAAAAGEVNDPSHPPRVAVVIPAVDEEAALPSVLAEIPRDLITEIVVVDNGSKDRTAEVAQAGGARVIHEPRRGYGSACLAGIAATPDCDVVAFLDGDHSDHPEDLRLLLAPLLRGEAEMVIGSRMLDRDSRLALLPQQRFGNWLASVLMRVLFGIRASDLGPFRVISRPALLALGMQDLTYGWTVEMQLRAHLAGLRVVEVPVRYRQRIGRSKISGTLRGVVLASWKILGTIGRYRLHPPNVPRWRS